MRAFAAGRGRRPRRDDRHRGRRRRAQRHRHGRSWTPTGSASPSCTSCAAGSAAERRPACACSMTETEPGPARERLDAVAATTDGFELARARPASSAARATCSARGRAAGRSSCGCCGCCRDEDELIIAVAREDAFALVDRRPRAASGTRSLRAARRHARSTRSRPPTWSEAEHAVTRIITGRAGGRRLQTPPGQRHPARPATGSGRRCSAGSSTSALLAGRPRARPLRRLRRPRARGRQPGCRRGRARRVRRARPPRSSAATPRRWPTAARGPRPRGHRSSARSRRRPSRRRGIDLVLLDPPYDVTEDDARGGAARPWSRARGSAPTPSSSSSARPAHPSRRGPTGSRRRWRAATARRPCGSPTSPARPEVA